MIGYKRGTKTWFGGLTKLIPIKSKEQKKSELLEDPEVIELMQIAYNEGSKIFNLNQLTFENLLKSLKP